MKRRLWIWAETADTAMHRRFEWSPRWLCDLAELLYGCPEDVPQNWPGGRPNRVARWLYRRIA